MTTGNTQNRAGSVSGMAQEFPTIRPTTLLRGVANITMGDKTITYLSFIPAEFF